jgi:REP element-mobilizing transposase RayT
MFAAARYWFVTDRCDEERHLLRPDPEARSVVERALRDAIEATGVGVVAFVVMGNHWHLVLRATDDAASIPAFMQRLKSDVAVAVNELRDRRGGFWADRYHAIPILDDASLRERITYCLMNPVAAGLSATVAEYPGLSSVQANTGARGACGAVDVPIELPDHWRSLDATELSVQQAWLRNELRLREREVKAERLRRGLGRPKPERCLKVDPLDRPTRPARRPPPRCFAATVDLRQAFDTVRRAFVAAYHAASAAFRAGVLDTMFPASAFPPRLTRAPVEATAA